MQSGLGKTKNWILEYFDEKNGINPLMGWESSTDTLSEVKLEFSSKENAISYAKKRKDIVVTHTFSKIFGLSSLRLGWAYCPESIAKVLEKIRK